MQTNKWKNRVGFFENKRKLNILAIKANDGGCAQYRLIQPLSKLAELYPDVVEVKIVTNPLDIDLKTGTKIPDFDYADFKWADVVMTNNISNFGGPFTARLCGVAKEYGCLFHFDTDDLLTELYSGHRLEKVYEEKKLSEITAWIYSKSDLVTVTQRKFAKNIQEHVGRVLAVVKNAIDYNLPCWNNNKIIKPKKNITRIGWVGGIHHTEDLKEFSAVPAMVNQRAGRENAQWGFYGRPGMPKDGVKDWQQDTWDDYQNLLLSGFKGARNWNIYQALPIDMYGGMYANIDVSIAPLQNNKFNNSKSDIKVSECGRYGVPLVASNVGCYDETIINGQTGYLIEPDAPRTEWVKVLSSLVKNPQKVARMGANLKQITDEQFDLNKVVYKRLDLYEQVFNQLKDATDIVVK
jgi:glycosyltransferase involved in cell wall biosynthesis